MNEETFLPAFLSNSKHVALYLLKNICRFAIYFMNETNNIVTGNGLDMLIKKLQLPKM